MNTNLLPIMLDGPKPGRQNTLLGVAEAVNPDRQLVLPDTLAGHSCCAEFVLSAREHTRHFLDFQKALQEAEALIGDQISQIPTDVRPVFLSYGSTDSTVLAGLLLKIKRPDTILVSIHQPNLAAPLFDLVVTTPAEQARETSTRMLEVESIPNRITDGLLAREREKWGSRLLTPSKKLVALVVGGSVSIQGGDGKSGTELLTADHAKDMAQQALAIAKANGANLVVTNSFRTPPDVTRILKEMLAPHSIYFYDYQEGGENPYFGYLACADTAIVTADSMSMISEVVDSGIETLIYLPPNLLQAKHDRFLIRMLESKQIKPLELGSDSTPSRPIHASDQIADEIRLIAAQPAVLKPIGAHC